MNQRQKLDWLSELCEILSICNLGMERAGDQISAQESALALLLHFGVSCIREYWDNCEFLCPQTKVNLSIPQANIFNDDAN